MKSSLRAVPGTADQSKTAVEVLSPFLENWLVAIPPLTKKPGPVCLVGYVAEMHRAETSYLKTLDRTFS